MTFRNAVFCRHRIHAPPLHAATCPDAAEERYEQRFACLEILSRPELLTFPDFQAATSGRMAAEGVAPAAVLDGAWVSAATVVDASESAKADWPGRDRQSRATQRRKRILPQAAPAVRRNFAARTHAQPFAGRPPHAPTGMSVSPPKKSKAFG